MPPVFAGKGTRKEKGEITCKTCQRAKGRLNRRRKRKRKKKKKEPDETYKASQACKREGIVLKGHGRQQG